MHKRGEQSVGVQLWVQTAMRSLSITCGACAGALDEVADQVHALQKAGAKPAPSRALFRGGDAHGGKPGRQPSEHSEADFRIGAGHGGAAEAEAEAALQGFEAEAALQGLEAGGGGGRGRGLGLVLFHNDGYDRPRSAAARSEQPREPGVSPVLIANRLYDRRAPAAGCQMPWHPCMAAEVRINATAPQPGSAPGHHCALADASADGHNVPH